MDVEKPETWGSQGQKQTKMGRLYVMLRLLSAAALAAAALVMALLTETETLNVAGVNEAPTYITATAGFKHTPAFVFFVIVNSIASVHNVLVLLIPMGIRVHLFGSKFNNRIFGLVTILGDIGMAVLIGGVVGGAVAVAEIGKDGNKYAKWEKQCDKFPTLCAHNIWSLIACLIGHGLLIFFIARAIIYLYKNQARHA